MEINCNIVPKVWRNTVTDPQLFSFWISKITELFFDMAKTKIDDQLLIRISNEYEFPQCFSKPSPIIDLAIADLDHWAQVAYQYSHEICHLVAAYPNLPNSRDEWFEEVICECASRKILIMLNETEKAKEIFPGSFGKYFSDLFENSTLKIFDLSKLTIETSEILKEVRANHQDRPAFNYLANKIFPIINASDCFWQSVRYLRVFDDNRSLIGNLIYWRDASPEVSRPQINQIIRLIQNPHGEGDDCFPLHTIRL